jgi:hypothetical protein
LIVVVVCADRYGGLFSSADGIKSLAEWPAFPPVAPINKCIALEGVYRTCIVARICGDVVTWQQHPITA